MKRPKAPQQLETARLLLRRPRLQDADAIFARYAADAEVTRYLAWPRHESIDLTRAFLEFSDVQWRRGPAGPYLIEGRDDGVVLGSTGLEFEDPEIVTTGYVLARDAWGKGYATEALGAVVDVARDLGVASVYALCHVDHQPSWRVLEKGGFTREALLRGHVEFPNLPPGKRADVYRYRIDLRS